MQMVEGRKDSLLVLPNGQMLTPRTFTNAIHMSKYYDRIEQFRLIQKKLDYFEVMVKTKDNCVQEHAIEQELLNHLRSALALDKGVQIRVRLVEGIPLDKSGKSSTVVSELSNSRK